MTDLKHLPKSYDEPLNKMTEKEWEEYFALRKELDVDMSKEDIQEIYKMTDYLSRETHHENEIFYLLKKIPLPAQYAYYLKLTKGLKFLKDYNLSLAKKEYPNEF